MMETKFSRLLEKTLKKAGGLEPATLGKNEILSLNREDKKQLLSELRAQLKFINNIIIAIVILHFLLFLLATFLVFYYRDSPNVILVLLGGSVLSLMVIIRSLVSLVKTKSNIDYTLITLPNLSPEQAMIMIQSIYFEKRKR